MPSVEWRQYTHSKRSETWHWLAKTPICKTFVGMGDTQQLVYRTRCKKEWEESELRSIPIRSGQYECTACGRHRKDEEASALRKAQEEIRGPKTIQLPEGAEYGDLVAIIAEIGMQGGKLKQVSASRKTWSDYSAPLSGTVTYWTKEQIDLFEGERKEKERANTN